jgi:putative N6-adenine-specific DNA methylase
MLEALAASTIMSTNWDQKSPFVNPMCGSGTLAIEAALIATKRAPGLFRNNYAFMNLIGYDKAVYEKERNIIEEQVRHLPNLVIIASDISRDAIKVAKMNATIAGVEDLIDFQVCDFEATEMPEPEEGAIVMINPEYGERLGEELELEATYARIGDYMKNKCKGMTGYIFTGNLDLAKKIRLKPSRRIEFLNAKIDCRLLEYELYAGTKRTDKLNDTTSA